jgi:outer membrane murein-binding lipoprotein Lpp
MFVKPQSTDDPSIHTDVGDASHRGSFVTRKPLGGVPFWRLRRLLGDRVRVPGAWVLGAVLACVVAAGLTGGCVDQAAMRNQIDAARQDLGALRDALAARQHALREALADPSAPADLAHGWRAQLVVVEDQLAAAEHAIDASADFDRDPAGGAVTRAIGTVAPFVPEPYRLPLVLGAGLAASLARGVQLRRAGRAIARGVQRALDADPQLATGFAQHADAVRAEQPPLARRLVAEAKGKRTALPI